MSDFLNVLAGQWLSNMTHDVSRYAIFAIGVWLVLWVLLAGVMRARKIRPASPPSAR